MWSDLAEGCANQEDFWSVSDLDAGCARTGFTVFRTAAVSNGTGDITEPLSKSILNSDGLGCRAGGVHLHPVTLFSPKKLTMTVCTGRVRNEGSIEHAFQQCDFIDPVARYGVGLLRQVMYEPGYVLGRISSSLSFRAYPYFWSFFPEIGVWAPEVLLTLLIEIVELAVEYGPVIADCWIVVQREFLEFAC